MQTCSKSSSTCLKTSPSPPLQLNPQFHMNKKLSLVPLIFLIYLWQKDCSPCNWTTPCHPWSMEQDFLVGKIDRGPKVWGIWGKGVERKQWEKAKRRQKLVKLIKLMNNMSNISFTNQKSYWQLFFFFAISAWQKLLHRTIGDKFF